MSVEEARGSVENAIAATAEGGVGRILAWLTHRKSDPSKCYGSIDLTIDRLILEVQAEMPCYEMCRCGAHADEETCGECPTCAARERLKVVV